MASPLAQAISSERTARERHRVSLTSADSALAHLPPQPPCSQQEQQRAALEALLKLESLRQSQQKQQHAQQIQQQQALAAGLLSQVVQRQQQQQQQQQHRGGNSLPSLSAAPLGQDSTLVPVVTHNVQGSAGASTAAPAAAAGSANVLLQQLWEQQQRAVLLAMLQQQQQKNLQQLLSSMALATTPPSAANPAASPWPHGGPSSIPVSGASSPVSGLQSPISGSQSPLSGQYSPLANSPSTSGPPSPRSALATSPATACGPCPLRHNQLTGPHPAPHLFGKASDNDEGSKGVAGVGLGRPSPKGVLDSGLDFPWDASPETSPRSRGAGSRCSQGRSPVPDSRATMGSGGAAATAANTASVATALGCTVACNLASLEGDSGAVELPSEEEFESHLFGVQLSFM